MIVHWNKLCDWWFFPTIAVTHKKGKLFQISFFFLKFECTYFKIL